MKTLIDTRPYIKTAIPSNNNKFVTILRLNQATKLFYSVVILYDVWTAYRKGREVEGLKKAGLDEETINFIDQNVIPGESPRS